MSLEVHIDWRGQSHLVGRLHAAERGALVSFEYEMEWLQRHGAFAIDPTSLPLHAGEQRRCNGEKGLIAHAGTFPLSQV